MTDIGIIGLLIILANVAFSYQGFNNSSFFNRYKFTVDNILIHKEYVGLISSGFLHVSWTHLLFNMISLYAFSGLVELLIGGASFLIIYFTSLIGGNLLALFVHRNHGDYSAVGASGAVCGIIFASIALFPEMEIGFIWLPFTFPSWIYGVLYVAYSIYGIKSKRDNIGHEAHLGGALIGMLCAIVILPHSISDHYLPILAILLPALAFLYLIITKPHVLLIDNFFFNKHKKYYNIDHRYNEQKVNRERELDKLLDKINQSGMQSLSAKERQKLEEYSR